MLIRQAGLWFIGVFLLLISAHLQAESINVAVASNFAQPMKELVSRFERNTGHNVTLSFGSAGKLYAQITHGAPFAVFLSADQKMPQLLEESGRAVRGSRFTYAEGRLVLWSSRQGFLERGVAVLTDGQFKRLALANPKLAPYGKAAVEVLEHLGLIASTRPKWIQGENISQTFQFVASGNAELGLVALSQVKDRLDGGNGSGWVIPQSLYQPIRQDFVLLEFAKQNAAAKGLLAFLKTPEARSIIEAYGYGTDAPVYPPN